MARPWSSAAGLWAGVFVALGYAFRPALMTFLGGLFAHVAPIAITLAAVAAIGGLAFWRWRVWVTQARPTTS